MDFRIVSGFTSLVVLVAASSATYAGTFKNITVDGDFSDWAGIPVLTRRRIRHARGVQRLAQGQLPRQQLPRVVDAGVEPGLDVVRDAVADIAVELVVAAAAVLAPAIGREMREIGQRIGIAEDPRDLAGQPPGTPDPGLGAQDVRRIGGEGGRRDEVDRPAERRGAIGQGIAAGEDRHAAQRQWVDLVEIARPVGQVHRDAVLQHLQPAQVEAAGDAGAAHRKPQFLPVAVLHEDAGRIGQHVAQGEGAAVLEFRRVDEAGRGRRHLHLLALLGDRGGGQRAGRLPDHRQVRQGGAGCLGLRCLGPRRLAEGDRRQQNEQERPARGAR